ncbi:MAG TPA: alpha-amylase family glycosyl hydrolase [Bacteroidales bacterium]|jgi:glycosidase|nr:alpha-amylase family glycosyl hydrolase [Bacteroidales bacterium]
MAIDSHSFLLHTPITLNLHETEIVLSDFIYNVHDIVDISTHSTIEVWYNSKKHIVCLEIIDSQSLPQVSILEIVLQSGTKHHIALIKSKKIIHTIRFTGYARNVQIAGDFNSWNPKGFDFIYKDGAWQYSLEIEPGNYSYQLIIDGAWQNDPNNNEVLENGYGGYNSLLRVPFSKGNDIFIETQKVLTDNIIIHIDGTITNYVVLWQNILINDIYTFHHLEKLLITIPQEAHSYARSFIRVYCFNNDTVSNDITIPLHYGTVVCSPQELTRDDKESQVIYFALIDRFYNGNSKNNKPIKDPAIHPKQNFHGGDICGITKKIKEGYFSKLGINTIWISPVVKNPDKACEKHGIKSAGYHGYWPIDSEKIDPRFGTSEELNELVQTAHSHNINIILDYVANHVHQDNPIIVNHPDWCTPLYLPDGSKNIGRWEEYRFTTWFEEFLPTLDYDKPKVVETMTNIAVEWIKKFDLDGFRHDATKHISTTFWRTLTKKLKQEIVFPKQKRLYQIGETFGGREMLKTYINSGIHDGQFSFNLYYETRSAFLYQDVHFEKLATCLMQELLHFGYHHLMGNISGNHDMPRFISYAGEDLWMNQNAEHEGWNRHITVKNPIGYKKLSMLLAFNCTIPGIPVIYYGDEIGMPGGGDPDNRRPMKFVGLSDHEQKTLYKTQLLVNMRTHYMPLMYGTFRFIKVEKQILIYKRKYFEEFAYVVFNKTNSKQTICFDDFDCNVSILHSMLGNTCNVNKTKITIDLESMSYDIVFSHKHIIETVKLSSDYYIA